MRKIIARRPNCLPEHHQGEDLTYTTTALARILVSLLPLAHAVVAEGPILGIPCCFPYGGACMPER